jgi:GR25 family glycosyltransferase involved in LPS biosynthesis
MNSFKVYLINLDNRSDRLMNVRSRVSELKSEIIRVSAVTGEEVKNSKISIFAPQNNVANWLSHMKVMSIFLESDDEYCVILEDDVLFINDGLEFLNKLITTSISEIDILQFGYVAVNGNLDSGQKDGYFRGKARLNRFLKVAILTIVKRAKRLESIKRRLERTNRILQILKSNEEKLGLKSPIVEGFEAGTHCYLVSRKAATALLNYNNPMLMVADLSLIVLSVAKNLLITRTTLSYATQDDSPVSTGEHSRYRFDLGTIILS